MIRERRPPGLHGLKPYFPTRLGTLPRMRRPDFNLAWYGLFVFLAVAILALVVTAIGALS
jgi:hypothetical protein